MAVRALPAGPREELARLPLDGDANCDVYVSAGTPGGGETGRTTAHQPNAFDDRYVRPTPTRAPTRHA